MSWYLVKQTCKAHIDNSNTSIFSLHWHKKVSCPVHSLRMLFWCSTFAWNRNHVLKRRNRQIPTAVNIFVKEMEPFVCLRYHKKILGVASSFSTGCPYSPKPHNTGSSASSLSLCSFPHTFWSCCPQLTFLSCTGLGLKQFSLLNLSSLYFLINRLKF